MREDSVDLLAALTGRFLGLFSIPILAFAIGFIVKKSTGRSWGYQIAGFLLAIQLLIMAILFMNKGSGG